MLASGNCDLGKSASCRDAIQDSSQVNSSFLMQPDQQNELKQLVQSSWS
jgi:hypothetical protein